MSAAISVNGKTHKLLSEYSIPKWLDDYFYFDSTVLCRDGRFVEVPAVSVCETCDRSFTEATTPEINLCPDLKLNKQFGYVVRCCIDCVWYIHWMSGATVPKPILKNIQSHKPSKIDL